MSDCTCPDGFVRSTCPAHGVRGGWITPDRFRGEDQREEQWAREDARQDYIDSNYDPED